jgi:hypothetical protein
LLPRDVEENRLPPQNLHPRLLNAKPRGAIKFGEYLCGIFVAVYLKPTGTNQYLVSNMVGDFIRVTEDN